MNSQIEQWRVQAYDANVRHIFQQKGSILLNKGLSRDSFTGKSKFYDRLGTTEAQDRTGRNPSTPNLDITHSRRMLVTTMKDWGTIVDLKDQLQNIHTPTSEYVMAAAWGMGRKTDRTIINALLGTARTGEDGSGTQTLGNAQKVAAVDSGTLARANVQLLRKMAYLLNAGNVMGKRYLVHDADFLDSLLEDPQITSHDYNTVKALVNGELNTFMGFEFVRCEILAESAYLGSAFNADTFTYNANSGLFASSGGTAISASTTAKIAFAYVENVLKFGENTGGRKTRIEERSDVSFNDQIYTCEDNGAVRMEEVGVVQGFFAAAS